MDNNHVKHQPNPSYLWKYIAHYDLDIWDMTFSQGHYISLDNEKPIMLHIIWIQRNIKK